MRRVVVTGAGVVSPLGDSPAALQAALAAGESALKPVELFSTDGLGEVRAGEVRPFDARAYLGERNLRPIDRTGRLLLAAAGQALAASGWTAERLAAEEAGLVLGTTFCSVRTIAEFDRRGLQLGPAYASPLDFANSVINAAAGQAAIWYGLRGLNSTLSGGEASGLQAIAYAAGAVASGRAGALLSGGAEELSFESLLGHHRAGRLAGPRPGEAARPVPFDRRRNGFALAEGAALLMLEEAGSAAARGAVPLAEVLGQGAAFATAPGAPRARAVERAVRQALGQAATSPEELDFVSASANGGPQGDRDEAEGLAAALGAAAAAVPVTAVKGALGEALGASGGLQAVSLVETLRGGVLPGVRGLEETDPGFPLGGVAAAARELPAPRRALVVGVGWDGHCSAVVFGKA
jgi:3-oxoacyl-[acyl-carrier-protein] synthase II